MPTTDLLHSHSPFYIFVFCGRASTHPIDEKKKKIKPSPSSRRFCSSKRTVSPKRKREIARRVKKLSSLLLSAEFYRGILLNTLITELQSRQRSPLSRKEAYPLPLIRTDLRSAIDRTNVDRRQRKDVVSARSRRAIFSFPNVRHDFSSPRKVDVGARNSETRGVWYRSGWRRRGDGGKGTDSRNVQRL